MDDGEPYDRLVSFLRAEAFPDAEDVQILEVRRPAEGGSWETFFLRVSIRAKRIEERWLVVRRAPNEGPLAPYDAAKDGLILHALVGSGIPIPPPIGFTTDSSVFSRPISVTELVEGTSHDLARIESWPLWHTKRQAIGFELIDTLANIRRFHWLDKPSLVAVLGPRGSASERVARMIDQHLLAFEDGSGDLVGVPQIVWKDIGVWLKDNVPDLPEEELVLVHGDYRFGNLIWQDTKISAVLDWERATLGDAMQDLGFLCMPMARRRRPDLFGMALTFDELLGRYYESTGGAIDLRRLQYYAIFWQFIQGSLTSRRLLGEQSDRAGGTESAARRAGLNMSRILGPNLHVRQTLPLIDAFARGKHDVL